jgi:hypothetical protein
MAVLVFYSTLDLVYVPQYPKRGFMRGRCVVGDRPEEDDSEAEGSRGIELRAHDHNIQAS